TCFLSKKIGSNGIYLCGYRPALCKISFLGPKWWLWEQSFTRIGRKNQRVAFLYCRVSDDEMNFLVKQG
ncbi:MAG TPA: hypothetical protein PLP49_12000, partial [Anaerohalosphaeraceae bacterium]|nr:hypothetical protein [Anaerohalosphaeraceae bacterium]